MQLAVVVALYAAMILLPILWGRHHEPPRQAAVAAITNKSDISDRIMQHLGNRGNKIIMN